MNRVRLDTLDISLLEILQQEGALSVAEVAARAHQSTTTCWRRIQQLELDGVIKRRVALLDRNALGLDVTIFAHVKLATTARMLYGHGRMGLSAQDRHAQHQSLRSVLSGLFVAHSLRPVGQLVGGGHGDQGVHRAALGRVSVPALAGMMQL